MVEYGQGGFLFHKIKTIHDIIDLWGVKDLICQTCLEIINTVSWKKVTLPCSFSQISRFDVIWMVMPDMICRSWWIVKEIMTDSYRLWRNMTDCWWIVTDCDRLWLSVMYRLWLIVMYRLWRNVADCDGLWRIVTECGWLWLIVTDCDGLWRNVADCDWLWRILTECDWLWLIVTDCDWFYRLWWVVTDSDTFWQDCDRIVMDCYRLRPRLW